MAGMHMSLVAQCPWWHNRGGETGNQFGTFILLLPLCRGHITTHIYAKLLNFFTGQYLNTVLLENLTQFFVEYTTKTLAERGTKCSIQCYLYLRKNIENFLPSKT